MNKLEQAARQALEALECLIWAATERDKKNRIRQFDEFVDRAKNSVLELRTNLNLENEMDEQQRNVMHVAWEALHEVVNLLDHRVDDIAEMWCYGIGDCIDTSKQAKEAMTVLREALDNPEERGTNRYEGWVEVAEQAEQSQLADATLEPVAWAYEYGTDRGDAVNEIRWYPNLTALHKPKPEEGKLIRNIRPLYAAPLAKQDTHATHVVRTKDPCHPWQDLTDDEIWEIADKLNRHLPAFHNEFARAVIAADREKNK